MACLLGPGVILVLGLGSAGAVLSTAAAGAAPDSSAWSWEAPRLAITHARGVGGDRFLRDEEQGWWRSTAGELSFETGVRLRRGGLRGALRWRGALGEHLSARGRLLEVWLGWRTAHWYLRAGRIPVHWGPAGGALLISHQAAPLAQVSLRTEGWSLPGVGGRLGAGSFLGYLDDAQRVVPYPLLWGMHATYAPRAWISAGARRTILFGGAGRGSRLTPRDLWHIFWGQGEGSSAEVAGPELFPARESDQKFAWHACLHPQDWVQRRLGLHDLEMVYTYAGEDRFSGIAPMAPARSFGARLHPGPRLALALLRVVTVVKRNIWYHHKLFLSGYSYRGIALGHPMGGDARGWRSGLWMMAGDDLLLGLRVDREERGFEKPQRVAPGGFWRWCLESTTSIGPHRLLVALEGAAPWGADRGSERLAESLVLVELRWGAGPLSPAIGREVVWGGGGESD
ncbi:MAG: hypothetical protein KAY32_00955 [Candidatus Eisenbacteria sp.]|nr:hypothetical protein [Candidatus Eisenbacteria bacterium]